MPTNRFRTPGVVRVLLIVLGVFLWPAWLYVIWSGAWLGPVAGVFEAFNRPVEMRILLFCFGSLLAFVALPILYLWAFLPVSGEEDSPPAPTSSTRSVSYPPIAGFCVVLYGAVACTITIRDFAFGTQGIFSVITAITYVVVGCGLIVFSLRATRIDGDRGSGGSDRHGPKTG